jgi:glutamate synthase domain-containing protein 3
MLSSDLESGFRIWLEAIAHVGAKEAMNAISSLSSPGPSAEDVEKRLALLTFAMDRRYSTGKLRRSRMLSLLNEGVASLLHASAGNRFVLVDLKDKSQIRAPKPEERALVIESKGFPMEGVDGISHLICCASGLGWKRIIVIGVHGQRFLGCGLGPRSNGVEVEAYGSTGDYLASGLDGASITVHSNGQDQLGQILNSGKFVVYGDVGQTFMYGAKGGEVFVLGNAAGRPLINAVGRPRVVINGTCLDYLAESFMAGDPLNGGGFVILNALGFDGDGRAFDLPEPYPGGNLFSLASGGAIYVRDPKGKVGEDQLNGGRIASLTERDWETILPYLRENERLFGISVEDVLLRKDGSQVKPQEIYKKVEVVPLSSLPKSEQIDDETD